MYVCYKEYVIDAMERVVEQRIYDVSEKKDGFGNINPISITIRNVKKFRYYPDGRRHETTEFDTGKKGDPYMRRSQDKIKRVDINSLPLQRIIMAIQKIETPRLLFVLREQYLYRGAT